MHIGSLKIETGENYKKIEQNPFIYFERHVSNNICVLIVK